EAGAGLLEDACPVRRDDDVASVVMDPWDAFDDPLRPGGGLQIAVLVRHADQAVAVGDIDPLGTVAWRIERDSVRLIEIAREHFARGWLGGGRPSTGRSARCSTCYRRRRGRRSAPRGPRAGSPRPTRPSRRQSPPARV